MVTIFNLFDLIASMIPIWQRNVLLICHPHTELIDYITALTLVMHRWLVLKCRSKLGYIRAKKGTLLWVYYPLEGAMWLQFCALSETGVFLKYDVSLYTFILYPCLCGWERDCMNSVDCYVCCLCSVWYLRGWWCWLLCVCQGRWVSRATRALLTWPWNLRPNHRMQTLSTPAMGRVRQPEYCSSSVKPHTHTHA